MGKQMLIHQRFSHCYHLLRRPESPMIGLISRFDNHKKHMPYVTSDSISTFEVTIRVPVGVCASSICFGGSTFHYPASQLSVLHWGVRTSDRR